MANICEKCTHMVVCRYKEPCEECNQFAEEVVRCKGCEYYEYGECGNPYIFMSDGAHLYTDPDDYCSYGEKREEHQQDCTYNKNGHCMGQKLMPECDAKNCDRRK